MRPPIRVNIDGRYATTDDLLNETAGTDREFTVEVTDSLGHAIPKTRYGSTVVPLVDGRWMFRNRSLVLQSGQVAEWHFWLNRMFDMTLPGVYLVTFIRPFPKPDGTVGKAVSNTLQLKISAENPAIDGLDLQGPERKTAD